jgi:hypothetical protein
MRIRKQVIQPALGLPGLIPLPRKIPLAARDKNPQFICEIPKH